MEDNHHRELCRRQHRILALEALLQAWTNELDALIIMRHDFARFLGLTRFKKARVDWLLEDMKPFFPYQEVFRSSASPDSLNSVVVSRVPLTNLDTTSMSATARAKRARKKGLRIDLLMSLDTYDSKETESDRYTFVSLLAAGLSVVPTPDKTYDERYADDQSA